MFSAKVGAVEEAAQYELGFLAEERRERERNRKHWTKRLAGLERQMDIESERVRAGYQVNAHRLEHVGLVYLWSATG